MASAKSEGSDFTDRKSDAPLAGTAAGESGVSATSAVSPAAYLPGDAVILSMAKTHSHGGSFWSASVVFPAGSPRITACDIEERRPFRMVRANDKPRV